MILILSIINLLVLKSFYFYEPEFRLNFVYFYLVLGPSIISTFKEIHGGLVLNLQFFFLLSFINIIRYLDNIYN